jgi:hypothetical protein
MRSPVTQFTKRDEVPFRIVTEQTARLYVMNLEIVHRPAALTAPAISP